jgi:hypothetical protein
MEIAEPSRQDPRTGNWFYRKWVKLPSGRRQRIFGATDEAGQPFKRKKDSDEAERAAIERLRHPEKQSAPSFGDWFHGRFWTEWVLGGKRPNGPAEQESKGSIYRTHLESFFGNLRLDLIDVERINTFRAQLRGKRKPDGSRALTEKTINNILAVLSTPLQ